MVRFRLFGVPILVEGWFWLSAVLLGGGLTANRAEDWGPIAVWTAVMFISVLVHELGHALAGRRVGSLTAIKLHAFGGTTYLPGTRLSRPQSIWVSAAGPLASLWLGGVALALGNVLSVRSGWPHDAITAALNINFFWTALNLLPIQPLDGGQILREALGPKWLGFTSMIGGLLAIGLCLYALRERQIFLALMSAILSFHNFRRDPMEGGVAKG